MTSCQKTYLEGICSAKTIKKGQTIYRYNDLADKAILIKSGILLLTEFKDKGESIF